LSFNYFTKISLPVLSALLAYKNLFQEKVMSGYIELVCFNSKQKLRFQIFLSKCDKCLGPETSQATSIYMVFIFEICTTLKKT